MEELVIAPLTLDLLTVTVPEGTQEPTVRTEVYTATTKCSIVLCKDSTVLFTVLLYNNSINL